MILKNIKIKKTRQLPSPPVAKLSSSYTQVKKQQRGQIVINSIGFYWSGPAHTAWFGRHLQEAHCVQFIAQVYNCKCRGVGRAWPRNRQPICLAQEIDTTEDSLSDSPPVILSASFPRSPVRILTTSETGITEEETTMSENQSQKRLQVHMCDSMAGLLKTVS